MIFSTIRRSFSRASAALVVLGLTLVGTSARAEFLAALGSTTAFTNALVTFDSAAPITTTSAVINITGVSGRLLSIDQRAATGVLYGLSDTGGIYTINSTTGAATLASTLSGASLVSGAQYSIDFNPTVDRLRIINDANQNLRVNVDTGVAIVDTALTASGNVAAGYTNSFNGATATTLFDLSYANGVFSLNQQNPANSGTIVPIGPTGIASVSSLVGFDISGSTGTAFVASNGTGGIAGNVFNLASINLVTGSITSNSVVLGNAIGFQIRGLAANVGAAVPEPASVLMLGLGMVGVGIAARRRSALAGS